MQEMKAKIRTFTSQHFPDVDLHDDQNFFQLGFVNSLFAMQLVTFVEKECAIDLDNDDLDIANFHSIDAIAELVARKRAQSR